MVFPPCVLKCNTFHTKYPSRPIRREIVAVVSVWSTEERVVAWATNKYLVNAREPRL